MTKPRASSSLRYTKREEMLPEGSEAVERQTDSGSATLEDWAAEYQVWNWVKGEAERSERESAPLVYWSAR